MKDCCNDDCDQGRTCPNYHRSAWTKGDVLVIALMLAVMGTGLVSLMWWVVKQIAEIMEVLA
jgi:hypothetical protein